MHKCIYDIKVLHVDETPPIILFDWKPGPPPDYPRAFLSGFSGTIVTDGYQVYHKIANEYAEIIKSLGDKVSKNSIAKQAYDMITKIMHEDNKYDNLTKKDRKKNRKLILKPMVNDYVAWLKNEYILVVPESDTSKAIRPFTIDRKNYLFCESVNGAKASAIIYSIVETAKANGLNVYKYLKFLITELSERKKDGSLDPIDDLLPWAKIPQR